MDCSDESAGKLDDMEPKDNYNKTFASNETNCDTDVLEKSVSSSRKLKQYCTWEEASDKKQMVPSMNSTERLQKSLEEEQELKREGLEKQKLPTTMLTCEICLQLFTENSQLTQHLLGHISSTSSYQTYDFDTGIKKGSKLLTKVKSSSTSLSIKEDDEGLQFDEDEEENNYSLDERMPGPISTPEFQTLCLKVERNNYLNAARISSPSQPSSSSMLETAISMSPTHMVKKVKETSPMVTPQSNKKDKRKSRKPKINTSNSSSNEKELKCDICQRAFTWSSALTRHLRIHSGEKPFSCEVCHKSFFQSSDLTQHLRVHTGERPFKCSLCTAAFSQLSALSRHLRCHFGEKPYVCSVCQRAFSQSSALSRHMCSHSEEKLFCCEICGKSFSWSEPLLRHVRTHTGEKPYKCEICAKTFSQTANLSTHMRVHSGEKPFKCPLCDRAFPVSSNLTRHMKTHKDYMSEQAPETPEAPETPTTLTFDSLTEPTI